MHVLTQARTDGRVMRAATALAAAGYAVSIVDLESDPARPARERMHGIDFQHVGVSGSFAASRFTKRTTIRAGWMLLRTMLRLLRNPADIYHAHDEATLPACFIAAGLRRKPLIYDAHELPFSETSIRSRWLLAVFTRLLAFMLPRCAGVITVSQPIAQELCRRYRVGRVGVIRNVPWYKSVPRSDRLRVALGLDAHTRVALYQGALEPNRGPQRLVRAARHLAPETVIVLMGPISDAMHAQLAALIAAEGVADRVRLVAPVTQQDLLDWISSADIGLILYPPQVALNIYMCLPNKFFEYLLVGLPVLSSQLEAVGDIIRAYDVGRITSSLSPADIGGAINAMLADADGLARMRQHALDVAREVFCWEHERGRLIAMYAGILERQNGLHGTPPGGLAWRHRR